MSNRFHNKFHRQNHHSDPTPGYPDSAMDPIASFEQPFKGEFYSQGDIITTENLSAKKYVYADDGLFHKDLTVKGNFTVLGTTSQIDTLVYTTSAVNISNVGTGPALKVTQSGSQPIAHFIDSNGDDIIFADNGYVGLGVTSPSEKLTVAGNLSSSGTATIGTIATGATNSVITQSAGLLQKRDINPQVWDTTAKFISASDGALTVNRLPKATNSHGINESIVFDDGINVGIGTDTPGAKLTISGTLSTSSTATIGTIVTGATNSVVIQSSGLIQKRDINPQVWDTSSIFVSASDGALTVNRLPKANNSNGINESIVYDDGTNVGIGTDTPGAKLTISGTLSTSGTATIGTLATNATGTSVVIENDGLLQKRTLNTAAFDTTTVFVSASDGALTVNRLTKAENSNGIDESIVFDDGTNVGIGTDTPSAKLTVSGTLSTSGTATIGTIATGTVNSVVIQSAGLLQRRDINPQVWDTTAKYVSASDGTLTVNRLTKAENSNGINESIVFDDGTNVGIGTDTPGAKLTVSGTLSTSGTATIGTIATNSTGTSFVIESNGLLQKRSLNTAALDTTTTFVSASDGSLTVNRLTKATNSNGINESIIFDSGTGIGIDTDIPSAKLDVNGSAVIQTDLTVKGNFTVLGTTSQLDTLVYATSAINITNAGTGPALTVTQTGSNPIAHFIDSNGDDIVFADNGYVGLGVASPSEKLTVAGNLSSSGTATIGTIATNSTGTSFVIESNGLLQKRSLNTAALDTTSKYVSASDGALTVNRLTKATNSNGINESVIEDDGSLVSIASNLSSSGTATIGTITTGATNSVITQSGGLLQKRDINPQVWDTTAKYVSASDGALTVNRLTKAENSNGIDESIVYDDGTNVGIGTDTPGAKLTVSGTLSTSGTATIGTIATGTGSSFVIESNGLLQKRSLNTGALNTTATFVSASDGALSVNYLTKATNSNGINESIISDNGSLVYVGGNVTISGNLTALGNSYFANTLFTTTSSISVVNYGTGPAIYAFQSSGNQDIASFYDGDGVEVLHVGNCPPGELYGKVGINESDPNKELTVKGSVSASGTLNVGTINTNATSDSIVVLGTNNILEKRTIDSRAWGSSLVDGTGTTNYVTKWSDSNTVTNSIVFDNGTNVGIGTTTPGAKLTVSGTLSTSSTVNVGGIGTGTDNSVVILDTNGFLRTDEINPQVWDTTAKYVSASDGALTVNRLTKAENSNGIDESIVFDNGTNVGIGTDTPSEKLTIAGNLSSSGTATIGTLATGTGSSFVIESNGLLQKRSLNTAALDTTSKFVSASDGALTVNRLAKATNSNGINESIVYDDGTNVGIGTDTPGAKLTVSGALSTSSTVNVAGIGTGTDDSVVILDASGFLRTDEIDSRVWGSSLIDGTGTANKIAKWSDSNTVTDSIVTDNGALVSIAGNLSSSGTATIGTLATGTSDTVIIESSGTLQKRTIDSRAWGSSLVDGTGTANRVAYWTDSNTITADADFFFDGTNVGIGTTTPSEKLTVAGNLSSSGTATIGTIAAGATNSVVIQSAGLLQKRDINPQIWDTTAKFVSASDGALTVNRLTKAENSNGIDESIVYDDGTNVGIGTDVPSAKLDVNGSAVVQTDLTVKGNFTVLGTTTQLDTLVYATSAISVTNSGTGPALTVTQTGSNPIAHFIDSNGDDIIFADNGFVGLGVASPSEKLTVAGNLSSSGTATIGTIATNAASTSFVVETAGLLQKRSLNIGALNTTAVFVSASDGALTINRLTKAENSNGIDESIVYDDGTNVGIGTDTPGAKLTVSGTLSTAGTATIGTITTGTTNSVVIESSGTLQKRTIDSRAWGSSLVDGTGTTNYVAKWSDADTVTNSIVFDNGTNVGIGTTIPSEKLTVAGNLSSSGTATIGTIAAGATNSVVIQSAGLLQKRDINPQVWDTTSKFVSASDGALTVNRLAKATNSNGINESIVYDDGANVGIGTDTPGAKLTVNGTLSTSSTVNVAGIGTGTDDSVVILDANGFLRTDEIDSRVWGSSLVDGTGTANRVAYWMDSNTISADSDFFFDGTNVGIGTTTPGTGVKLDVNGVIRSVANTVTPAATTALPSSNDVILNNQTGPITITAFSGGVAGVTYTITNKSTHAVTLDTSASLFVRGGNSWASHKCTTNAEGYIVLPQNFSCSLRMDSSTSGSAW